MLLATADEVIGQRNGFLQCMLRAHATPCPQLAEAHMCQTCRLTSMLWGWQTLRSSTGYRPDSAVLPGRRFDGLWTYPLGVVRHEGIMAAMARHRCQSHRSAKGDIL